MIPNQIKETKLFINKRGKPKEMVAKEKYLKSKLDNDLLTLTNKRINNFDEQNTYTNTEKIRLKLKTSSN